MKTKEELIKIYSAYLPYGLSVFFEENNAFYPLVINNPSVSMKGGFNINEVINEEMKPLLWDMDMLTKEIEHKGERFIPIEFLMKMRSVDINNFCCENRKQKAVDALLNDLKITNRIAIDMFNKLLEWHLNVFGLDESEYIKK